MPCSWQLLLKNLLEYPWKHINTVTVFGVVFKYSEVCMWVSILRTFLTPIVRIGIFSISFILYYLICCVSKNLFSGSAIYFIDQYLIVFSVYNEYIFTLTWALTGDFCHGYNGINGWTYFWKKTWHISVCMVLFFPQISHCSSLWNSGTLTLVNNIFSNSDVTPRYGTNTTDVVDLFHMQREKSDPWDAVWNLFVDNLQSSQYLEMSRFLTASSDENAQACAQALSDFMLVFATRKGEIEW